MTSVSVGSWLRMDTSYTLSRINSCQTRFNADPQEHLTHQLQGALFVEKNERINPLRPLLRSNSPLSGDQRLFEYS